MGPDGVRGGGGERFGIGNLCGCAGEAVPLCIAPQVLKHLWTDSQSIKNRWLAVCPRSPLHASVAVPATHRTLWSRVGLAPTTL